MSIGSYFWKICIIRWVLGFETENYLELMDNLLADNRIEEASEYLELYRQQKDSKEYRVLYYEWKIAYAKHDKELMKQKINQLEEKYADDGMAMFLLADLYAETVEYDKAIFFYEKSFDLEKKQGKTPLYTDALESIALIYQITGQCDKAIEYYDKVLVVLKEHFGFTEGKPVNVIIAKKNVLYDVLKYWLKRIKSLEKC